MKYINGWGSKSRCKKMGSFCLVIMFTPRVTVINFVANGSFFVLSADSSKQLVIVWGKYLSAPERSYQVLPEKALKLLFVRYWGQKYLENCWVSKYTKILFFSRVNIFRTQKSITLTKSAKWDLLDVLKYFAQTVTGFLLSSGQNT